MAFRIEAAAFLISGVLLAGDLSFPVRHQHGRGSGDGVLTFTDSAIKFDESGKKATHSRTWTYAGMQRLVLSPGRMRIITYDDVRWQLGRDREYVFDQLPVGMAAQ